MTTTPLAGTGADPQVGTLMSRRLVAVVPEATTLVALRLMVTSGVRHLPVVSGPRVLGVVTETDLLHALGDVGGDRRTAGTLVRRTPALAPTAGRTDAARAMQEAGVDAVLVVGDVTDGGRLLGIVTATDLLRSLAGGER